MLQTSKRTKISITDSMTQYRKEIPTISKCEDCTAALLLSIQHIHSAQRNPGDDNTWYASVQIQGVATSVLLYIKLSALTGTHCNNRNQTLYHHLSAFKCQISVSLGCIGLEWF